MWADKPDTANLQQLIDKNLLLAVRGSLEYVMNDNLVIPINRDCANVN